MKAIYFERYGGPEVLQYGLRATPKPGPEQVLIEVHAAAVNPRDWMLRQGTYFAKPFVGKPPIIPGSDVSGVVAEVGVKVTDLAIGDEVFAMQKHFQMGGYAEFIAIDAKVVGRKPAAVSHIAAAATPVAAMTAWQCLFDIAKVSTGSKVTIVGAAGGVGHYAVQLARDTGAVVTGVCGPDNIEFARELGAIELIDRKSADFREVVTGQDLLFDTIGRESLGSTARTLGPQGVYVTTVPTVPGALDSLRTRVLQRGGKRSAIVFVMPRRRDLEAIGELLAAGRLRSVIGGVYPLAEAAEAHRQSRSFHTRGKLVLQVKE